MSHTTTTVTTTTSIDSSVDQHPARRSFRPWWRWLLVALAFHRVVGGLLRRHTERSPILHAVLLQVRRPAGAVWPLLALQVVWQAAPNNLAHLGLVRHVNGVLLIGALTWLVIGVITSAGGAAIMLVSARTARN